MQGGGAPSCGAEHRPPDGCAPACVPPPACRRYIGYKPGDPTQGPLPTSLSELPAAAAPAGAAPAGAAAAGAAAAGAGAAAASQQKVIILRDWSQAQLAEEATATIGDVDPYGSLLPERPYLPPERNAFITGQKPT